MTSLSTTGIDTRTADVECGRDGCSTEPGKIPPACSRLAVAFTRGLVPHLRRLIETKITKRSDLTSKTHPNFTNKLLTTCFSLPIACADLKLGKVKSLNKGKT